jgi:hypothetical protein
MAPLGRNDLDEPFSLGQRWKPFTGTRRPLRTDDVEPEVMSDQESGLRDLAR